MKLKLLLILSFIFCSELYAQINIRGSIIDHEKKPVPGATVFFIGENNKTGGTTDESGSFDISLSQIGSYSLEVSSVGFKPQTQSSFHFLEQRTYDIGVLALQEQIQQLQTVEVLGRMQRDYNSEYSFSATKIAIKNKDLPQSIATITKELIADRQAFYLADAVKIASGVIPNSFYNQFSIRGISQNEEGVIINGMRTRQHYFNQPLTNNIDRIEVIKGPASATFSSVDPGGSINLVTKKPLTSDSKELSLSMGSFSTMRGTLDFTGPLNEKKTLLYRVNAANHEGKSFRDLQGQNAILISPSFSYVPNSKTAVNVEMIYTSTNGKIDRGQPIFGSVAGQTNLNSTPISFAINATNDFFKSKEVILIGNMAYKITDGITINISYMKQSWTEDLMEHRTTNRFAVDVNNQPVSTLAAMQMVNRNQYWNIDNLNSYFNFDFNTGSTKSKLLVGYDASYWHKLKGGGQNAARGYLLLDGSVASTYNPENQEQYQLITMDGVLMPRPNVEHFNLSNPNYNIKNTNDYVFATRSAFPQAMTTTNAIYVQEQFSWQNLLILLGLRNEWFSDITNYETDNEVVVKDKKLLPRVGITYALNKHVNLYTTYLEGFQPHYNTVTLMPVVAPTGGVFEPLKSNLKELGVKTDFLNNKLHVTAAIYEVNQKNILMNANDAENPDLLITRGAERSRGFELDLAGYVLEGWQVKASYSFIDAIILNDQNPDFIGSRKQNTPIHSGNLWSRYDINSGSFLNDMGIGLGMQCSSNMIPWFVRDFNIPSFIVFDAALYYAPAGKNFQIALNGNNILNSTYWIGAQNYLRLFPGTPRNFMLTATFKF